MNKRPKISVGIITYNQELFIGQTIDSILMQKGDFNLEIIIGEDCSPDNTYAVCLDYQKRYPDIITVLHNTKNIGITANFFRVLQACTGDFIADMAGDDYYCDDHAFDKQLKYLLQHSDVGVIAPNGYNLHLRSGRMILGRNERVAKISAKDFYFNPNFNGGVIIEGGGLMFRRDLLQYIDFDEIVRRHLPVEDLPIQAIWSQHTKFGWLPDPMVVYRVYIESATHVPFNSPKYLSYHKGLMDTRRYLNELFPQDACFSEEWMQDYEFYKEYLLYLHKFQYKKAKDLIAKHSSDINRTPFPSGEGWGEAQSHYLQAKRMTRSWLRFVAFAIYKKLMYKKELKHNM